MNTYDINDEDFIKSDSYKKFIKNNPSRGSLKIRAYAASEAVPIEGLKVVVSTIIDDNNVIFYEGKTNDSGVIEKITLPAPKLDSDNLDVPLSTPYEILATYEKNNLNVVYKIIMYEDVCVVQNINVAPSLGMNAGDF